MPVAVSLSTEAALGPDAHTAATEPVSEAATEPVETRAEERANVISHGLGLVLALASVLSPGAVAADVPAAGLAQPSLGHLAFFGTMVLMYAVSTGYHLAPVGRLKVWLRRCDHAVIYLFIAGTFTPYALASMRLGDGWAAMATVWVVALAGAGLKLSGRLRRTLPSTLLYLAFGWLVVLTGRTAVEQLSPEGLTLLVAGGLAYTAGCPFFLLGQRMRYSHSVWHLFVMLGTFCHVMAMAHVPV